MKIFKLKTLSTGNILLRLIFFIGVAFSQFIPLSSLSAFVLDSAEEYAYLDSLAIHTNDEGK